VSQECEQIHYTVKANERLSNIADQFSVPEQEIKRINNMDQDTLYPSMSLLIPICAPTTPGTTNTAITTFTPLQGSTTTPVNWPTQ
jgi:LysM repeat protein